MDPTSTPRHPDRFRMGNTDPIPSSSPAFGTPARPFRMQKAHAAPTKTSILPILLPPATLRPVAFRTFTRKHNLTISSPALQTLAVFVGKNCGSGWREEGLAEKVLDEVAKIWKRAGGGVIVEEGKGASLKAILQSLEGSMSGGRVIPGKSPSQDGSGRPSSIGVDLARTDLNDYTTRPGNKEEDESQLSLHPRHWLKVIDAFDLPRLTYNVDKKYFESVKSKPTFFPPPSHKTTLFRDRYNLIYQRLLRNESFQDSLGAVGIRSLQRSSSNLATQQSYKLTPISNLLGRSGTSHLILGLLTISPTGDLALVDLTGTVSLDLSHARMIPEDGAWFAPGMIVLVDGIYEEEEMVKGSVLGGNTGVGGAIGGHFVGVSICGPPCERRDISLGTITRQGSGELSSSGGFGWVDFLGIGSERAQGARMRRIQDKCLRRESDMETSGRLKIAVMSEINLDNVKTLDALRRALSTYNDLALSERPQTFVLIGNFVQTPIINGGGRAGSIEYKEHFDSLAVVLSEFPALLQHSTFVFVPGDNDPWASSFSTGAASTIPRQAIPGLFTSRIRRAFATANSEIDRAPTSEPGGEALWTSNPARLSWFGPVHDIAIFRDDISGRLRRTAINAKADEDEPDATMHEALDGAANDAASMAPEMHTGPGARVDTVSPAACMARKLVKTVLDQGSISPFPLSLRPVLWDHASAAQLYPLPTALILADSEAAPFCMTYEGCHVMNPGRLLPEGDIPAARWVEYDLLRNRGKVKEERF
ncbi:DNA polymerase alpha/epsilon subunit B [Penicillium macrosclerotiorum]|uniref:DNA polymerase alpha/epsilon subunit B n=1 Tax=Penicillium macrosclerotiorum TaxID=303699 RepID=UPI002546DBA6|nr:DNA polymerase alpha/epsilon subunit B [Penicillium macrosclerotiorum]KAJ5668792.1 DNA polymerase alpha/epsilon subunit B [Penicillium macrosclerotiorum]